jgi:hypothetical protein
VSLDWSERILLFPVRAAAVDTFLHDLKRKRSGDLNGLLATLNDGSLCREVLRFWLTKGGSWSRLSLPWWRSRDLRSRGS